jgi:polysaccharide export outer membrane protein
MRHTFSASTAAVAILLSAGCATAPSVGPTASAPAASGPGAAGTPGGPPRERGPAVAVPPPPAVSREVAAPATEHDYKLAPKDQLTVTVHGQDDLTRTVRVSQTGTITLPLLGEVKAAGQTVKALEDTIESGLRGRYLKQPKVNVAVAEYQGRQVSVLGAVNQPGAYGLKTNATTVLAALSDARGVKDTADRVAYVVRATPRAGEPQPLPVDLEGLLRSGDTRQNVVLEGGDTVFIPEANQYYVAGEVEKRGAYTLRRGTTVSKALTEAGGVTKRASGEVKLIRTLPTGEKREMPPIDLAAAMQGDRTQDVELQAQDVVVVPAHGAKVAAYGVLDFLKGLFSIGIMP